MQAPYSQKHTSYLCSVESACDLDCAMTELHSESQKAVGIRVPEFMGDLWRKENAVHVVWLEPHDLVWQTQNQLHVLVCNPIIHMEQVEVRLRPAKLIVALCSIDWLILYTSRM